MVTQDMIFTNAEAKWIGRAGVYGNEPAPAPFLRKCFNINKEVREATIYVSGLGQYEGFINGKPLDERIVLAPAVSDYTKTVYYNQYSIGDRLVVGDNVLAFVLGRGRYAYNTPNTPWNGEEAAWIDAVKMIAVLEVTYKDGSIERIVTDEDWEAKASGIVQDCMYLGEKFDARLHDPEWNQIVCGSGWESCALMKAPAGKLKCDTTEPIVICERIKPTSCTKIRENVYVYKFEEYVSGWLELKLTCPRDTVVSIQYAERVDDQGEAVLKQSVTDDRLQCDYFISSGETFIYHPQFSYKGFYYVQVEGAAELTLDDAVACYVHNDVKSVSSFSCSDSMLNWFHHAFRRTVLSNLHGVSEDTPVFEKLGWTGDANAVAPAVLLNFDMRRFYRKWLEDFRDSQTVLGEIPPIIPTTGWGLTGAKGWKDVQGPVPSFDICYPELVYRMYWCYGNKDVLEDHYVALKKYATYLTECANGGLYEKGLGDWLPPTGDVGRNFAISPEGSALISGAYHIRIIEFMEKIAATLGIVSDERSYAEEKERLIILYHDTYFDPERMYYKCKQYDGFRQAPNVLALAFGIVPNEYRNSVLKHILEDVKGREYHHCMGIFTVQHLLNVLSEEGYHEVAYKILTVKGYPGWDYQRENGLRTLSESWECKVSRSFCHYGCGASDYWVLTYLAGVHQLEAGFKKVRIEPMLPENMDYVQFYLDTVNGRIEVTCERSNGQVIKRIRIDERIEVLE